MDRAGAESRGKVHNIPVSSGPYATDANAKRRSTRRWSKPPTNTSPSNSAASWPHGCSRYDARTIKQRFMKDENKYHDVARYSVGWMHENFALLEFGPDFRNELDRRWTKVRATSRLGADRACFGRRPAVARRRSSATSASTTRPAATTRVACSS